MKYIITESKIQKLISSILDNIHIRVVTNGDEMTYPSGKYILSNPPRIWNEYIKHFGPIYVMKYDGLYYVVQYQTEGWMVVRGDDGRVLNEKYLIDLMGLSNFGFDLNQLIGLVKNKT